MRTCRLLIVLFLLHLIAGNIFAQNESFDENEPTAYQATFLNGDLNDFRNYIENRIKYPKKSIEEQVYGRILVKFRIDSFGNLTDITLLRSVRQDYDEAVINALLQSPKWSPATINKKPVSQWFVVPFYNNVKFEPPNGRSK